MTKRILLALLFALVVKTGSAEAITFTPTGATADVAYKEPTTNADGTPLTDLSHCNVYLKVNKEDGSPLTAEVKLPNKAATALTGGGNVSVNVAIPVTAGTVVVAVVQVTCSDTSGNESVRSASVSQRLDKLAPAGPQ